jgi:hypothetical protein
LRLSLLPATFGVRHLRLRPSASDAPPLNHTSQTDSFRHQTSLASDILAPLATPSHFRCQTPATPLLGVRRAAPKPFFTNRRPSASDAPPLNHTSQTDSFRCQTFGVRHLRLRPSASDAPRLNHTSQVDSFRGQTSLVSDTLASPATPSRSLCQCQTPATPPFGARRAATKPFFTNRLFSAPDIFGVRHPCAFRYSQPLTLPVPDTCDSAPSASVRHLRLRPRRQTRRH